MVFKDQPNVAPHRGTPLRSTRSGRLLSYIAFLSAAVALSTILQPTWSIFRDQSRPTNVKLDSDPALEWKDNVWPIRQPTPWDISTDFQYPRKLEYDVTEGTWLRLDVHPTTGDIVFDMVGDLYCLPGAEALHASASGSIPVNARPVLQGVPYDSDPRFSPEGDRLVFQSDAELGVNNIWIMEWKGCDAMDLRRPQLGRAFKTKEMEEDLLAKGVPEDSERKGNRLVREGRLDALRVTNETYTPVRDARFHPSGSKVIAGKWYTPEGSAMCTGEGWEYPVPSLEDLRQHKVKSISAGSGRVLVGRTLPRGFTVDQYSMLKIGAEELLWHGNDSIIYAKNAVDEWLFTYNKDVHKGIYAIFMRNLTTGATETIVNAFPGGASRPELSRDGRTLAFVRRVRDKEALVFKDLLTGSIHNIWHGLSYDLSTVLAPMGTYPSFAFTPDDDAVVIWAAGQIYLIPLSTNSRGEKIASTSASPRTIPFRAHIEKRLAETRRETMDLVGLETQDTQRVHAFRELRIDSDGSRAVFEGGGHTYWQNLLEKKTHRVPALDAAAPYYSASFVPGTDFVVHAKWSDSSFSSFELANINTGKVFAISGLPFGRYFSPVVSDGHSSKRTLAFLKSGGTYLTGDILATAQPGLYLADLVLPEDETLQIRNARFVASDINVDERVNIRFIESDKRLLVQQTARAFVIDLTRQVDRYGQHPQVQLAEGRMAAEVAVSTRAGGGIEPNDIEVEYAAWVDFFHVYVAPGQSIRQNDLPLWSRPGNATKGLARISLNGGHDITWSPDGRKLFWLLGPSLHSLEVSKLRDCASYIHEDPVNFGISCTKKLVDAQEIIVEHETEISRLKKEAASSQSPAVLIVNATILSMQSGNLEQDLVRNGSMYVCGGVIQYVLGPEAKQRTHPPGTTIIDAHGGFVVPGFIDVHAHWDGYEDRYPAKSWEMETFLAYGVTTQHNPSADTVKIFLERTRIENGLTIGPRVFAVGTPILGGHYPLLHQEIIHMDEASAALSRIKAEGGPAAVSYKNYNLVSRAERQRLLIASRNLSMLAFPEAGMHYDWDLTYIIDGMTTVEHALPVPRLYNEVMTLYALSGTGSTPTHLVNYPGASAEEYTWATEDIPNDPKLRRFTRHDILYQVSETSSRPRNSFAFHNTSASVADMVAMGQLTHVGAHGEPPLGFNYHAEMNFAGMGGLSNYQVIQAATSSAARTLGVFSSIGSLSRGKLADFLVYPTNVNILEGAVGSHTRGLLYVARSGRIWRADTMEEFWPVKGRKQTMPVINPE